jgi:hypothetical protein
LASGKFNLTEVIQAQYIIILNQGPWKSMSEKMKKLSIATMLDTRLSYNNIGIGECDVDCATPPPGQHYCFKTTPIFVERISTIERYRQSPPLIWKQLSAAGVLFCMRLSSHALPLVIASNLQV